MHTYQITDCPCSCSQPVFCNQSLMKIFLFTECNISTVRALSDHISWRDFAGSRLIICSSTVRVCVCVRASVGEPCEKHVMRGGSPTIPQQEVLYSSKFIPHSIMLPRCCSCMWFRGLVEAKSPLFKHYTMWCITVCAVLSPYDPAVCL